jgi:hypothetical protein
MADRYCRNCGNEINPDDRFCSNCGRPVHQAAHVPTPEADVPVPPPPPQQTRSTVPPPPQQQTGTPAQEPTRSRPILMGCLAIIGILVLLGIVGAALGGGGDSASSPPEQAEKDEGLEGGGNDPEAKQPLEGEKAKPEKQQPQRDQANQSQGNVYSIGDQVKVGDVSYKVTSARQATQLRDPFGVEPPMKGNFILVTFIFTNSGDDPATVSDIGMYLYDSQGREFETDTDAAFYLPQDKSLYLLDRVNPGLSQEVQTVYSVPPDARGFELEVTSGFWATETARIKLGF